MSSLVYLLVWSPPPHIPYISSPNHYLLFSAHAHTIATCFAVVSILYRLFLDLEVDMTSETCWYINNCLSVFMLIVIVADVQYSVNDVFVCVNVCSVAVECSGFVSLDADHHPGLPSAELHVQCHRVVTSSHR